jgi:hypothetical protein
MLKLAMAALVQHDMKNRRTMLALLAVLIVVVVVLAALNSPDFVAGFRDGMAGR